MEAAIAKREEHFRIQADGRCQCLLNGHVFGSNPQDLLKFIGGAKYQRLLAKAENEKQIKRYEPFIHTSKNFGDKMYCSLTCHLMNKNLASIERHVQGKKYRKAKELHDKGEFELIVEPDLVEEDEDEDEEETEAPMDADITIPSRLPTMEEEAGVQGDEVPEVKIQQAQAKCGSPMRRKQRTAHHKKKRQKAMP
ncbi:hypothetical protein COCSUDRAFT_65937 [Coccomyxa subellipsoidea C-169]|uniref:Surfeit locus protein 2 n=1 Tax=Coccomyxa subellipsoidea (strain C-169) TaxID=574566 RepID=I0YYL0_COCSC|nr:hypothetical protein COCSUDRAFT_65937 [Coccomyxa subellipsoidea C-169]EIE23479.1 hypothetical protein COCSUDRAFT_65937 [Coccomyxa subellipsoidea C-169]|eukprot:XP_005648023.1 hypothetical protein COCSUDRAFT_65937 [Coccomyxa subellipsoidea C-169]